MALRQELTLRKVLLPHEVQLVLTASQVEHRAEQGRHW